MSRNWHGSIWPYDCDVRLMLILRNFPASLPAIIFAGFLLSGSPSRVFAETVTIDATEDATLIEDDLGLLANGSGPALFAGRTGQSRGGIRRALIRFDLTASLPLNAVIERVTVQLHLTPSNEQQVTVRMHRLLQSWSEGPSSSSGGSGDISVNGDATWLHTLYDSEFWMAVGGHYVKRASAAALIGAEGFYRWQSSPHLIADVRSWQHASFRNFGWILVGDENTPQSVKRFDSRESWVQEFRPKLTIQYRLPGGQID